MQIHTLLNWIEPAGAETGLMGWLQGAFGMAAFGVIALLAIWKVIVSPILSAQKSESENLRATAAALVTTAAANEATARANQATAQCLQETSAVLDATCDSLKQILHSALRSHGHPPAPSGGL